MAIKFPEFSWRAHFMTASSSTKDSSLWKRHLFRVCLERPSSSLPISQPRRLSQAIPPNPPTTIKTLCASQPVFLSSYLCFIFVYDASALARHWALPDAGMPAALLRSSARPLPDAGVSTALLRVSARFPPGPRLHGYFRASSERRFCSSSSAARLCARTCLLA